MTLSADDTQKKRHPNGCLYRSGDARALSKHASDVFVAEVCKMREHFGIGKKRRAFQHWTSHGICEISFMQANKSIQNKKDTLSGILRKFRRRPTFPGTGVLRKQSSGLFLTQDCEMREHFSNHEKTRKSFNL